MKKKIHTQLNDSYTQQWWIQGGGYGEKMILHNLIQNVFLYPPLTSNELFPSLIRDVKKMYLKISGIYTLEKILETFE